MANANKLVIVESPAKAKTIGKFLGRGYKVEASQGHVRDLPKSQLGVDVENGFEPKYITIRGRGEILSHIRKEARGASKIFLATDPDREGEAISWHLANVLGIDAGSRLPHRVQRDHGQGGQGRDEEAAHHQYESGRRAAGAPRARPPGRL